MQKPYIKDYCALTMALTDGLLVPAKLDKKLCENSDMRFGFANIEYANYAELHFQDFVNAFRKTVLTSSDLIILFQLDAEVMQQDMEAITKTSTTTKSLKTQTEFDDDEDYGSSGPNQIKFTWNVWDFHRETIRLANIRQKCTQSTQSKLCYGTKNAQSQYMYARDNNTQK